MLKGILFNLFHNENKVNELKNRMTFTNKVVFKGIL